MLLVLTLLALLGLGGFWWWARRPLPAIAPGNFGAEITSGSAGKQALGFAAPASAVNAAWVRYNGVLWSMIEPTAPVREGDDWRHAYDQAGYALPDAELRALSNAGITSLVVLRGTPSWAVDRELAAGRRPGQDTNCFPINPAQIEHFVTFVEHTVRRYAAMPYRVHSWEIWNEPDAARQAMPDAKMPFGCWGNREDAAFYGGEAYGNMLRQVYDAIKAVDPTATVVLGGLMLTGDDTDASGGGAHPSGTGRFLQGVLHALYPDGQFDVGVDRPAFDRIAFHNYAYWANPAAASVGGRSLDWDLFGFDYEQGAWSPRSLTVAAKIAYLHAVLGAYGLDPPILLNEGALLCYQCKTASPAFVEAQANYLVRMYVRAWGAGLDGATWYALNDTGWQQSGLHTGKEPRPGIEAFRTLVQYLGGATFLGPAGVDPVEGYRFQRDKQEVHIYWTNDSTITAPVSLPDSILHVFDRTGAEVTASVWDGQHLIVGFEPLIVVREP